MLMAPAIAEMQGVTLFGDDSDFWRFYPIPRFPAVRLDEHGKPMFLLVRYALSDEDIARDPSLPPGGGYLSFDVELSVPAEKIALIVAELQPRVDAEWSRLRAGSPAERERRGVAGTTAPPAVELATPTWTGGQLTLDMPRAERLVERAVAEGTPSLLAGNIASFSVDLTHAGADLFRGVLLGAEGGDSAGLGMLQVKYDLKFWARLPPARVSIHAQSEEIHRQVTRLKIRDGWTACSRHALRYGPVTTQEAEQTGLVTVHVDPGTHAVSAETLGELREFAMQLMTDMLEQRFFSELPEQGGAPEQGPAESKRLYFKPDYDSSSMSLDVNIEQSAVVEWPIHPQGSLAAFFHELAPEVIRSMIVPVELGADEFRHLDVMTRVYADFSDSALAAVEVAITYEGIDEHGVPQSKSTVLTFSKDATAPQRWRVGLIGSERWYRWAWRPIFMGREPGDWSTWTHTSSPAINASVIKPGRVQLEVVAGDIDFQELIELVEVTVAYEDAAAGVPRSEDTVHLAANALEASYERLIFAHAAQPLQVRARFKDKLRGRIFEEPWQLVSTSLYHVNQPFLDTLPITVVPTGNGWDAVALVTVELRYEDLANDYRQTKTLQLQRQDDLASWRVVLRNPELRSFLYQISVSYRTGEFRQGPWTVANDTTVLHVDVKAPHRLDVQLVASNLDFTVTPTVEVEVRYDDAGVQATESFVFTQREVKTYRLPLPDGAPLRCTYVMHYHLPDGSVVSSEPVQDDDGILVLRPYVRPKPSEFEVSVLTQFVDFVATPLVLVALRYEDPDVGFLAEETLTFDARGAKSWKVAVPNASRREFAHRVTYFDAAGTPAEGPWKVHTGSPLVIPRLGAG